MAILFDGRFKATDKLTAPNIFSSGGVWETDTSAPQMDSITIAPAIRRPGRYAARFFNGKGPGYNSRSSQHNLLLKPMPSIPDPNHDVWYGFSMMFDDWQPSGYWAKPGIMTGSINFNQYPAPWGNNRGLSTQMGLTNNVLSVMINKILTPIFTIQNNVWYDIMFHINWAANPNGSLEMWLKKEGETKYSPVFEKRGFETYFQEFRRFNPDYTDFRFGIYRSEGDLASEQAIYLMDAKIATLRADIDSVVPIPDDVPSTYKLIISNPDRLGMLMIGGDPKTQRESINMDLEKYSDIPILAVPSTGYAFDFWKDNATGKTYTANPITPHMDHDYNWSVYWKPGPIIQPGEIDWAKVGLAAGALFTFLGSMSSSKR